MVVEKLKELIRPLTRRIFLMLARAIVENVDDSKTLQYNQVSLLSGEIRDNLERFQNYGVTASPPVGSEAIAVFLAGNRDHGIILAVENREYRISGLSQGEVCIYTDEGDKIHLKRGNKVEVTTNEFKVVAATKAEIEAPIINMTATVSSKIVAPIFEVEAVTSTEVTSPKIDFNSS